MKRLLVTLVVLAAFALPAHAARSVIVTLQDQTLATANDCESFRTQNTTSLAAHATSEEQRTISLIPRQALQIHASEQGGVSVRGWDRDDARLLICKCAAAETPAKARAILDAVSVSVRNGEIRATGPEMNASQVWWTHMVLHLPKRTNIAINSTDGGVAIRNLTGTVFAASMNGPIAIDRVSGSIDARSANGPISLKVRPNWIPSIVASTEQGGTIHCYLPTCRNGSGAWTSDRKQLSLYGEGGPVRLTTTGAPIVIDQVR